MYTTNIPPRRRPLADGSGVDQRAQTAVVLALDAGAAIRRAALRLIEELDEATNPHGQPITDLEMEDSAVTVVDTAKRVITKR